jgi:hypothetical protein
VIAPRQNGEKFQEMNVPLLYDRNDDEHDGNDESEVKHLRAGVRVNSRVKVALESKEEGRSARTEGHTMDISAYGCLAIVPEGFEVGETLLLTNLINKKVCEAVLVWRGHQGSAGWELGLQLRQPSPDFWELEF